MGPEFSGTGTDVSLLVIYVAAHHIKGMPATRLPCDWGSPGGGPALACPGPDDSHRVSDTDVAGSLYQPRARPALGLSAPAGTGRRTGLGPVIVTWMTGPGPDHGAEPSPAGDWRGHGHRRAAPNSAGPTPGRASRPGSRPDQRGPRLRCGVCAGASTVRPGQGRPRRGRGQASPP